MNSIEKLIELFRNFPGMGPKSAARFVFYLLKLPKTKIDELINNIESLKKKVNFCSFCFNPFEGEALLCPICTDKQRDKNLLCVVEKETDLLAIEKTKKYNGFYFILGGTVATMKKDEISNLRLEEFKKRIKENNFSEIIIALNPTPEGRVTSLIVESVIKEIKKSQIPKISHLGKGIPVGGEIEYADPETLESALEGRR